MSLAYARIHVIYRVNRSEYIIRILIAAPQEYVNTYSTHRVGVVFLGFRDRGPSNPECDQREVSDQLRVNS